MLIVELPAWLSVLSQKPKPNWFILNKKNLKYGTD